MAIWIFQSEEKKSGGFEIVHNAEYMSAAE